jgi:uncharacterized protein YjbI with pentapeptide repeats
VDPQQQTRWWPTRRRLLWICGVVAALVVSILIGYRYGITLWDWIKLLVVPAVIAAAGLWFNAQQREREQQIANERAQDEALQAYLDGMSQLLTDKERPLHRAQEGDSLSTVARARTLNVLLRLDGERKRSVLLFLSEANLIAKKRPIVSIAGADLREASLHYAHLNGTNLSGIDLSGAALFRGFLSRTDLSYTDLSRADLSFSQMIHTDLYKADLRGADLTGAILMEANLRRTDLSSANLSAAFGGADLSGADLNGADLSGARLNGDNLSNADLTDAKGMSNEELEQQAASLEGATMPDGQKYEDWLKSKDGGEDGGS